MKRKQRKINKGYRILQQPFNVETDLLSSYIVLVETINDKPVGIAIIEYPDYLKYLDNKYEYYQINPN
jgi:hypothetical protein